MVVEGGEFRTSTITTAMLTNGGVDVKQRRVGGVMSDVAPTLEELQEPQNQPEPDPPSSHVEDDEEMVEVQDFRRKGGVGRAPTLKRLEAEMMMEYNQ